MATPIWIRDPGPVVLQLCRSNATEDKQKQLSSCRNLFSRVTSALTKKHRPTDTSHTGLGLRRASEY